jgi:L-iditol 2-dehydrogenase
MRALIVTGWGRPAEFAQVDEPAPCTDECLVQVDSVLLGAGDVFFSQGVDYNQAGASFAFPHIPGFRGSGVVASVAPDAPVVGTRVAINGVVGCNACPHCATGAENLCSDKYLLGLSSGRFGGLSEFMSVPVRQLHPIPDHMSFTDSLLAADIALLIHAFRRGRLILGESLAVLGAGRIGTAAIAVAKAAGAWPLVAIDSTAVSRQAAIRAGATQAIDPSGTNGPQLAATVEESCGAPPDVVLEAVGRAETIATALALGRGGGRTILLGLLGGVRITANYYADVISKENELITTFGKTNDDFRAALQLIGQGHIGSDDLPVRTFPWRDALEAWTQARTMPGSRNAVKVATNGAP